MTTRPNLLWKKILKSFDEKETDYENDKTPEGVLRHKQEIDRYKQWKADIIKAQKNWITFRDSDCYTVIDHEYHGGTANNAMKAACAKTLTDARIKDLEKRYQIF